MSTVILLRYLELRSQIHRLLSIMKMRESLYDTALREFRISSGGIDVADSFASAESILSGQARLRGEGDGRGPAKKAKKPGVLKRALKKARRGGPGQPRRRIRREPMKVAMRSDRRATASPTTSSNQR
ncbi:hypothetical protein [Archangium sp.]|uniref:hypothetical protein n=1 Tax=Archangium sp. TaxID=1872627 RepID=UPI00389AEAF3